MLKFFSLVCLLAGIGFAQITNIPPGGGGGGGPATASTDLTDSASLVRGGASLTGVGNIPLTTGTAGSLTTGLAPTRGDIVTAQGVSPAWLKLAKGTQFQVLTGGATEPAWGALSLNQATAVSGILGGANGGTGNGFTAFTGPTTSLKTFTLPDANATLMTTTTGVTASQLPNPGPTTLGGVKSITCTSTDKISAIGIDGLPVCSADQTSVGGGAPTDAHYLTNQAEAGLSAEVNLGLLTTGILKISVAGGVATPSTAVAADFPTLNQSTTGNAATATALAAIPTKCSAGNYPLGIDVNGNAQNCTAVGTSHTQNTDTGTTATSFQIDSGNSGPRIKNAAGVLEVRNAADSAYADLKVNTITTMGTGAGDLTVQAAPASPAASHVFWWADSTALTVQAKDSTGVVTTMVKPITCSGTDKISAVGTNGIPVCSADQNSGAPTIVSALGYDFGDPSSSTALTAGATQFGVLVSPFACTLASWDIAVDAGTATVKLWKVASGTAIPTSANSINTSGIAISTGTAIHSTTLTDFTTTAIAANDIIAFNLSAVATAKYVHVQVNCTR